MTIPKRGDMMPHLLGEDRGLVGESTLLRELQDEDVEQLAMWANDPSVASLQVPGPMHPKPKARAAELFKTFSQNYGADVGLSVATRDDGTLVGHVMLYGAEVKDRSATLAIMIGAPFQRRGYGSDALRTIVRYGFRELGLHRIELTVNDFNLGAIAAYRALGFIEEGRRRQAIFRGGRWHDHVLMGLLENELD